MKAKRHLPGIAEVDEKLITVDKDKYSFTLGNDTDIVVQNRNGGMSIISVEDVLLDDEDIINDVEAETTAPEDDEVVQDDLEEKE